MSAATAPGRCTLAGEHVDYADGVVVCMAVDLHVTVTLRAAGAWSVRSGDRFVERDQPSMQGDIGDRVFASLLALREHGMRLPPCAAELTATLPESAGLSSSAAVCCGTVVAGLRLAGATMPAAEVAAVALHAEREIVGVPCGPLDQRAVVHAPEHGVLLLDCADASHRAVPWLPGDALLVGCWTGSSHDIGGAGYAARRRECDAALAALGADSWRQVTLDGVDALDDPLLRRRARHIVSETQRALEVELVLRQGDAEALGALMNASHDSLRDDYEVSSPELDAAVEAARAVPGCLGARMVGGGFGGTVTALVRTDAEQAVRAALEGVTGGRGGFALHPAPGLAVTAPDVVRR